MKNYKKLRKLAAKKNKVQSIKAKCLILLVIARPMKRCPIIILVTLDFATKKTLWKKVSYK